jgi:GT2 family glycosyltransferase
MATAVLDLDFNKLPQHITGLDRYHQALILIRLSGQPVGKAFIPVTDGKLDGNKLHEVLVEAAGWPLVERWLHDYLSWDETWKSNSIPQKATVAVCTRDRPDDLERCLDSLRPLAEKGQEILVIDNCPTSEATRTLVERFECFRYIREERLGLNVARNRALREAQHDIVAFTDDDAVPDRAWLDSLLRNFNDPLVMCVTGLTMPLELETKAQEWFERYNPFSRGFSRKVYDHSYYHPLGAGRIGAGANMAFRRSVMECVGFFDEALDGGTPTHSGGDTEMFSRIMSRGYRIVYEPAALNWHRHRQTREELRRTIYGYGVGVYAFWTRSLLMEKDLGVLRAAFVWFFRYQLRALLRSLLRRPNSLPLDLILAEIKGSVRGPFAYLTSRKLHAGV